MSLRRTFRRTLALEERTREETHDGTSAFLLGWFRALEESTEQASRGYLPTMIDLRQFDPNQELPGPVQHRFFRPWPLDLLEKHEKNNQIPEATKRLLRMQSIMEADDMGLEGRNPESITWERTRFLCARLGAEVQVFPRNGTEGNRQALSHLTRWRHESYSPFDEDLRSEFKQVWVPGYSKPTFDCLDSWTLARNIPHVKLSMFNEVRAEEGIPLRSELLSIIAIMLTRLRMDSLKKHVTIPVMLFSFVAPQHGRIILAHYDGGKLVVHMSSLYRFCAQDEDSMLLFTRYLASDIDPEGVTTYLGLKK